ncbi:uncharacterized protein EI90DRAFT_3015901 [Cantharellus anzutake]|uniref:uncharacterized protein n=1 Tax=Cantharellus anzutake TaxID=1750568 RepID=UPI001905BD57|nr:uncharacterized protein EI90DRAFT_3015901 [Cantharellus anzutake]KAF8332289.1 hypothetical protein EI90DRAFT_3015901 [Cantharellus anzutake]
MYADPEEIERPGANRCAILGRSSGEENDISDDPFEEEDGRRIRTHGITIQTTRVSNWQTLFYATKKSRDLADCWHEVVERRHQWYSGSSHQKRSASSAFNNDAATGNLATCSCAGENSAKNLKHVVLGEIWFGPLQLFHQRRPSIDASERLGTHPALYWRIDPGSGSTVASRGLKWAYRLRDEPHAEMTSLRKTKYQGKVVNPKSPCASGALAHSQALSPQ